MELRIYLFKQWKVVHETKQLAYHSLVVRNLIQLYMQWNLCSDKTILRTSEVFLSKFWSTSRVFRKLNEICYVSKVLYYIATVQNVLA